MVNVNDLLHSRIRQHHLFWSLFSSHLLRGIPTSLLPLGTYYKTCWCSLLVPFCLYVQSISAYSIHSSILAFTENIPNSCLITLFLILLFCVHPFTYLKKFISTACIWFVSFLDNAYVSEQYKRVGTAITLQNFIWVSFHVTMIFS